jgi:hypothetical protein
MGFDNYPKPRREKAFAFASNARGVLRRHFEGEFFHLPIAGGQRDPVCSFPQEVKVLFFQFPEDARWDAAKEAIEFSVILGPYEGTVRVPKRSIQGLLDQSPTPQRCLETFHLQRMRFELIVVERKLRRRQLTNDGNVEITGRDLRERTPPAGQRDFFHQSAPAHV